ncbi:unnamed protein product, partial [Mesorhabditis belari]|uniref:Uncharacterized protein n=1 Tax=Mesorhabditis belari TaxID=2138241 RepID=A0AAF3FAB9_9BILA
MSEPLGVDTPTAASRSPQGDGSGGGRGAGMNSSLSSTPTPTPPLHQDPGQFMQMPPFGMGAPFFANPFMSPFMPQGAPEQQNPSTAGPQPFPVPPNNQMGFFVTPSQYQEMMQQYFQQMMASAALNMPFPMPLQQQFIRPESQASSIKAEETLTNAVSHIELSEQNGDSPKPTKDEPAGVFNGDSPSSEIQASTSNKENTPNNEDTASLNSTKSGENSLSEQPATQRKGSSEGSDRDNRTASLIQKQMSEIEKEISRRTQNKNIKQIDDAALAELMGQIGAPIGFTQSIPTQAALPFSSAESQSEAPLKQTLNQLRSSFNLPETGPPLPPPQNVPQQQALPEATLFSQTVPMVPNGVFGQPSTAPFIPNQPNYPYNTAPAPVAPPAPFIQKPPSAQFTTTFQNAPAEPLNGHTQFVQAPSIASIAQARLSAMGEVKSGGGGGGGGGLLDPPPPAANPVFKRNSHSESRSSENGGDEEPVWVMRDSYLRRIQREQEATVSDWPTQQDKQESPSNEHPEGRDGEETDRLLVEKEASTTEKDRRSSQKSSKETLVHEPAVLIEGVLFRARYLGSTQLVCEGRSTKTARMAQAQEAVARVKAPDGELQPSTDIDLFISTEKIMVLNTDLQRISDTDVRQDILMDHALRTISYIADIGDLVVLMARRMTSSGSDETCNSGDGVRKSARVICHVFESEEAAFIAQSIGQAFQVAYVEFLRANGIDDPSYLRQIDYQEVLNSQELLGEELEMFSRKETQKDVVVPKKTGEALGVVVVESGWGSMLPTVVLAHMSPMGPAARSNQLNVGDQIIAINGISLVGLPLSAAQKNIQNVKTATAVRLTVVNTPPVVEVRIRRPDTKYQLGFSVQNGVICSLLRGGIAERGGIRVGHRIIEINHQSVVAVAHDRIVNMLATAVGEIQMKTMPTSMFRLLTGQEVPNYI